MKVALVLGAGGLVGTAHHAGVLCALEREAGFTHADADIVIGTSAGSAIGAYLRTGWTTEGLMGRARDLEEAAPSPVASNPIRVARHAIGSAYILARTAVRVPSVLSVTPTGPLRRAFPAGLVTIGQGLSILDRELPRRWPDAGLWLAAYDLVQRKRVVLSARPAPYLALPEAVRASCAIPGVYTPVHVGDTVLVDGGVWSLTNLDLALAAGCDVAVCVAPLAYDPTQPPAVVSRTFRHLTTRWLAKEVAAARRAGLRVVVLAPGPDAVQVHGVNLMRGHGLEQVAEVAYHETCRWLRRPEVASGLLGAAA
ncbi:MAG TPA: patatin-like phospholipase family protein [Acidimicrobiales bacterium]|nr:patatin-like phospholipase family protein [Acidimicrobiales bacterium]